MAQFKDNTGRSWAVSITVQTVEDLRAIGFNIKELLNDKDEVQKLYDDAFLIVDILTVITNDQRKERDVTTNDFFKTLGRPELDKATEAFLESLVDFFQNRQRALLVAMLAKWDETYDKAVAKIVTKIDETNVDELLEASTF